MAVIETWLRQDLKGLVTVRSLQGQVFSLDNGGNLIGVKVTKDGTPVTLTGTVTGYCILSDGQTVTVTGSGSSGIQNGNEAYIVLPQLVYSVPGQISIVIKLTSGSVTTTLAACTGYVYRSRTSNEVVPPGTPIPDLATMEEVIQRATAATESANTAATGAENVNASMAKEGDVITISVTDRDGNVTEKTVTDQSNAVAELGKAVIAQGIYIETESQPIVSISDGADDQPMKSVKVAIEPVQDLHGYDAPWPAGGGENLLDASKISVYGSGITYGLTASLVPNGFKIEGDATSTGRKQWRTVAINQSELELTNLSIVGFFSGTISGKTVSLRMDVGSRAIVVDLSPIEEIGEHISITVYPVIYSGSIAPTSWTPYSNVCPITGWTSAKVTRTGKNLLNPDIKAYFNDNMYFGRHSPGNVPDGTFILPAGTYTASASETMSGIYTFDSSGSSLGLVYNNTKITFTNPKTQPFLIRFYKANATEQDFSGINMWMESGSTASAYEIYQGQTYEVTFPADPGTVYGGTLDVASGKLVVDRAYVGLTKDSNWTWNTGNSLAICHVQGAVIVNASNQSAVLAKNNMFTPTAWVGRSIPEYSCGVFFSASYIFVRSANHIASLDDLKTVLGNDTLQVVYKLAQPVEVTMDAMEIMTLLGENHLWSDCGDSSITYPADTKLYIDKKIAELQALILENNG